MPKQTEPAGIKPFPPVDRLLSLGKGDGGTVLDFVLAASVGAAIPLLALLIGALSHGR